MNCRENFQRNFSQYLKKFDKTQLEVARHLGVSKSTVSAWAKGVSYPRADVMERLAMYFQIPISYLIADDPEPPELIHAELTHGEMWVINAYRNSSEEIRAAVIAVLSSQKKETLSTSTSA